MNTQQVPNAAEKEKHSHQDPEHFQSEADGLPSYLPTQNDDADAKKTHAPTQIGKEGNPYPQEEQAPCDSIQFF